MKNSWKKLFSRRKRLQIILIGIILVVLVALVFYIISDTLGLNWPSNAEIDALKSELQEQQQRLLKAERQTDKLLAEKRRLEKLSKRFWPIRQGGHIDVDMRSRIEKCAKDADLELQSMGNIRKSSLLSGINKLEISISSNTELDKVIHFLDNIRRAKPDIFWQNCNIRPNNMTNPDKVYLNGTLTIITIDRKEVKKLLSRKLK